MNLVDNNGFSSVNKNFELPLIAEIFLLTFFVIYLFNLVLNVINAVSLFEFILLTLNFVIFMFVSLFLLYTLCSLILSIFILSLSELGYRFVEFISFLGLSKYQHFANRAPKFRG